MASRYGDAMAAQAVTEVLDRRVAQRRRRAHHRHLRSAATHPHDRATVIDDGRRSLGVLAVIEDVSERRRLEDIRRDFIANVSPRTEDPHGCVGSARRDAAVRARSRRGQTPRRTHQLRSLPREPHHRGSARPLALESEGSPAREPVPVSLFVAEAIERIRTAAEQHKVTMGFVEPENNLVVVGDRRQLVSARARTVRKRRRLLTRGRSRSASSITRVTGRSIEDGEGDGPFVHIEITRPGCGHSRQGLRADLRALLPSRSRSRPRNRRHRTRAQYRAPRRSKSRRHRARGVSRRRRFGVHPRTSTEPAMTEKPDREPRVACSSSKTKSPSSTPSP